MLQKLQFFISIFATLIVLVGMIVLQQPSFSAVNTLIGTIIFYYFFGLILRSYLQKKVFSPEIEQPPIEQIEENPDEILEGSEENGENMPGEFGLYDDFGNKIENKIENDFENDFFNIHENTEDEKPFEIVQE